MTKLPSQWPGMPRPLAPSGPPTMFPPPTYDPSRATRARAQEATQGRQPGSSCGGLGFTRMSRCAVTLPWDGCAEVLVDGRLSLPHHGLPALADGHDSVERPADVDADPLDPAIRE